MIVKIIGNNFRKLRHHRITEEIKYKALYHEDMFDLLNVSLSVSVQFVKYYKSACLIECKPSPSAIKCFSKSEIKLSCYTELQSH